MLSGHIDGFLNLFVVEKTNNSPMRWVVWSTDQDAPELPSQMQLRHGYSLLGTSIGNGKKERLKHAWHLNGFKERSRPSGQAKTCVLQFSVKHRTQIIALNMRSDAIIYLANHN